MTENSNILTYYQKLLKYTLLMSCLVFLEDSFVIFNIDVYSGVILNITNRNFSEDILRITQSVIIILYFFNFFLGVSGQEEKLPVAAPTNDYNEIPPLKDKEDEENEHNYYIFHLFC